MTAPIPFKKNLITYNLSSSQSFLLIPSLWELSFNMNFKGTQTFRPYSSLEASPEDKSSGKIPATSQASVPQRAGTVFSRLQVNCSYWSRAELWPERIR